MHIDLVRFSIRKRDQRCILAVFCLSEISWTGARILFLMGQAEGWGARIEFSLSSFCFSGGLLYLILDKTRDEKD